jgi:signal peptidase II
LGNPLIVGVFALILDQLTKCLVVKYVSYGSVVNIIPMFEFFNITNVHNTGMAFSMLQGRNFLFSLFIFAILSFLAVWLYRNHKKLNNLQKYAFCLAIFGGLANLVDRFFRGAVVDFLDFGINSLRWPSFNIADSCVCIGTFLIIVNLLFLDDKSKN